MSRTGEKERLMYANGFLEQRRRSPAGLAGVIAVHGAGLAALIAFGTTTFVRQKDHNPIVISVPRPHEPPPVDQVTAPPTDLHLPAPLAAQPTPPTDYHPPLPPGPQLALNTTPTLPPPVRRAAQV